MLRSLLKTPEGRAVLTSFVTTKLFGDKGLRVQITVKSPHYKPPDERAKKNPGNVFVADGHVVEFDKDKGRKGDCVFLAGNLRMRERSSDSRRTHKFSKKGYARLGIGFQGDGEKTKLIR